MELSNKQRVIKIKRCYTISMLIFSIIAIICFWYDELLFGFIACGFLLAGLTLMQFFQVNYIYYNSTEDTMIIRFHPSGSMFGGTYSSIDFEKKLLYKAIIKRSSAFSDLSLYIKTQRGILEYPDVSLVGLTQVEIELIEQDLQEIIAENQQAWLRN